MAEMRLIDANALMERLEATLDHQMNLPGGGRQYKHGMSNGLELAMTALRVARTVEVAPRWISVTERLPRPGERVLVNIPGCQFVGEMYITDAGHWKRYDGNGLDAYWDDKAKWWMPMPPGKEEQA